MEGQRCKAQSGLHGPQQDRLGWRRGVQSIRYVCMYMCDHQMGVNVCFQLRPQNFES
jgi:hypothetical protein